MNAEPGGRPRVAIYSQDGLGLGHQRRTSAIAAECLRRRPDAAVLLIADSPLGAFFGTTPGQDYLKLPSIRKLGPGNWEAVSLGLDFPAVAALRADLLRDAILGFRPDVLLVDHMPHGAMGELVPMLDAVRAAGLPTRVVLGLRDVVDDPATVRRVWREEGAYDALSAYYDRVLVYGERSLFDLATEYRLPQAVAARTRYCGYVCNAGRPRYAGRIRGRYRRDGRKLIVAMAGGGADAYPVLRTLLDALPAVQDEEPVALLAVTGPFMPADERRDLQARAAVGGATVRMSVSDTMSYLEAADLVVAMAGYNTSVEILRSGTPAVLVPRLGPSAEQRIRTARFAARGWIEGVDPRTLSAGTLAEAVIRTLRTTRPRLSDPDLGGLATTCDDLLGLRALA
jgi:predicted glycosyltransferase